MAGMGGVDASIPLGIKTPDTFSTIGQMVNIAKGVTDLNRSKVALEQDTGKLDAMKAVGAAMQDPANHNEDGTVNLDKFSIAALNADPKNYVATDYIGKAAHSNNQLVQLKGAALALGDQVQSYIGQRLGAAALDPAGMTKDQFRTVLDDAVRIAGPGSSAAAKLREITLERLKNLPDDPIAIAKAATAFRNQAFPIASQQPTSVGVQTGARTEFVQGNPNAGPVGAGTMPGSQPVPNQIGPQGAQQLVKDALGRPALEITAPSGEKRYEPVQAGAPKPLMNMPTGENAQSASALAAGREAANAAARTVPEQRFNNQQIIKLAGSGGAITGANADTLNKMLTSVGLQGLSGEVGKDYNLLGHFIAMQAQQNAKAMGAGTDAARGLSEQATASRQWTGPAIVEGTKILDALASGTGYFNQGLERAITDPSNQKDIFAARDFQNAWAKNFDVNAMRLLNAKQAGDTAEYAKIIKDMGGKGSPGVAALAAKVRALDSLIETGRPAQ